MSTSNDTTRICKRCKDSHPLTDEYFPTYKNRVGAILFRHLCYACWKINRADMRKRRNPEKVKAEKQSNFKRHPETNKKRQERYIEKKLKENPNYFKDKTKADVNAVSRATKWIEDNRERFNAAQRKRRINNPILRIKEGVCRHKRRALMKAAEGSYTPEDIQRIFEDQNERCAYCGITLYWSVTNDIHIDHIHPLAKGGTNWPDNLSCSCADCNLSKGDKSLNEWIVTRGW